MQKILSFKAKLLEKIQIAKSDFKLIYDVPAEFSFKPGQFVGIRFQPTYTRAYSIVDLKDGKMELLIDVNPGGLASKYFEKTKVGDQVSMLGPYGIFSIKSDLPKKVFICTGTGVAPFIPMIKSLDLAKFDITLLFGTKTNANDIAYNYFAENISDTFKYIQCVTREEPKKKYAKKGRVTEVLQRMINAKHLEVKNTEFYLCGSNQMIADVVDILKNNGADKIFYEKYG